MTSVLVSLLAMLGGVVRSRAALHLESLALRHQLQVLQRSRPRRLHLAKADRWLWVWLSVAWNGWRGTLMIVKPDRHRVASPGPPVVLEVEESPTQRATARRQRCALPESKDVEGEPALGCPPESR